jgi:hypothetical protein
MSWCFQRTSPVGLGTDWMQLDRNQRTDGAGDMGECMQDALLIGATHDSLEPLTGTTHGMYKARAIVF